MEKIGWLEKHIFLVIVLTLMLSVLSFFLMVHKIETLEGFLMVYLRRRVM